MEKCKMKSEVFLLFPFVLFLFFWGIFLLFSFFVVDGGSGGGDGGGSCNDHQPLTSVVASSFVFVFTLRVVVSYKWARAFRSMHFCTGNVDLWIRFIMLPF
ncbi:hypothetical protein PIB30_017876 [Stylosanthes scabra]|uniref:Transmembrane protein n=1 Tax=Stylosanthes scabra TaxID=79078 RepID=A0ABU6Y4S3_9FABA|nr:hypothetical protein [Stylosanthes scabra]